MSASIAAAVLEQVDRELAAPPDRCLVCNVPSDRDYCSPVCRWTLWKWRRGIECHHLDLWADREVFR